MALVLKRGRGGEAPAVCPAQFIDLFSTHGLREGKSKRAPTRVLDSFVGGASIIPKCL